MKPISRADFDNLRLNDNHEYDTDDCSGKRVVRIYAGGNLIAKQVKRVTKHKTKSSYFAIKGYQMFLVGNSA